VIARPAKTHTLTGADGKPRASAEKGTIGGHRGTKIFGRLDCPAALRAIARGQYVNHRVLFADLATATQAGYRPCAVCMPDACQTWKPTRQTRHLSAEGRASRSPSTRCGGQKGTS